MTKFLQSNSSSNSPWVLGIEGGGTRTVALMAEYSGKLLGRLETGPTNLRLVRHPILVRRFAEIRERFPNPDVIAIGLAGVRTEIDRQRIVNAGARVWQGVKCLATNDLVTALSAQPHSKSTPPARRVLILSGTGSCCYGEDEKRGSVRVGGWGHLLGDKGSGYEIGLRALKAVVYYFDRDGTWPALGQRLLRFLQINLPDDLIGWVHLAKKEAIAALAPEVFAASKAKDKIATDILEGAASSLVRDGLACAARLGGARQTTEFILAGGLFQHQPHFARLVARKIRAQKPSARVVRLQRETAWGAVNLGRAFLAAQNSLIELRPGSRRPRRSQPKPGKDHLAIEWLSEVPLAKSPTELRHPRSVDFDRLTLRQAITLMLTEDAGVPRAILKEKHKLEAALRFIVRSFQSGGRLFYAGAGTSGRLGVLDASECPPTFGADPAMVQGIIAGGQEALWRSIEGAEDNFGAGAEAVRFRGVNSRDVVVGIAASGRTPFVWGALIEAQKRGATTILLCFNPLLQIPQPLNPDLVICPNVAPELLTGSTRLKCGTATKMILNIFTTVAMTRLGKVMSNLMVDLRPSNVKLRDRAVRIVQELTGSDMAAAKSALIRHSWVVRKACQALRGRNLRSTEPAKRVVHSFLG